MAQDEWTQLQKDFRSARRVSTPLIMVATPDGRETARNLGASINEKHPQIWWDTASGLSSLNKGFGSAAISVALQPEGGDNDEPPTPAQMTSPIDVLGCARKLPGNTMLVMHNLHLFLIPGQSTFPTVVQAIWNLRDLFKKDGRTLVILSTVKSLPPELIQDFMIFEEELPNRVRLAEKVLQIHKSAGIEEADLPEQAVVDNAVDALRGLAASPAEQIIAMSLYAEGKGEERKVIFDIDSLWARKRELISQTKGLAVDKPRFTFADTSGQDRIQLACSRLFSGPEGPNAIGRIDEIEKMLAGATGPASDSSGVSQDALGVVLRQMEDYGWPGILLVGPPGSGKTLFSTALGGTFKKLSIALDLGAMKGSYVGESEASIRAAMAVLSAVSDNRLLVVGTCNRLDAIPAELRRRFKLGIWFMDLPAGPEREIIWNLNLTRFKLDPTMERPDDKVYTGSDIRNVCEIAWRFSCDLLEASTYIVPVAKSDPISIERLRVQANNKFLSAAYEGVYRIPAGESPEELAAEDGKRAITLDLTGGKQYGN